MTAMISRREFVTNVAATTAAVTIVPRHVLGRGFTAPSDRLNIAGIGVGGMGRTNLLNLGLDNNIVALCDVDWGYAGPQWTADAFEADLEARRGSAAQDRPHARGAQEQRASRRGRCKRIAAEDLPKHEALHRLPPDARTAEGHRRGRRRDARSHARADRDGGAGSRRSTSTCRSRCAGRWTKRASCRARRGRRRRPSRRWATRATRGTTGARPWSGCSRARSAT